MQEHAKYGTTLPDFFPVPCLRRKGKAKKRFIGRKNENKSYRLTAPPAGSEILQKSSSKIIHNAARLSFVVLRPVCFLHG